MTLTEAQAGLAAALANLQEAEKAQSVSTGSRSVSRAALESLRSQVTWWQRQVSSLTAAAQGATNPTIKVATWN